MTGFKKPNVKHLMLFSGRAYPELTAEVAEIMDVEIVPTRAISYANSEIYVRFEESVRGSDAFVLQSHAAPVNEWIMEQLIMVDALKRASAKRITVVAPFYPYARQDKKHRGREPISARLVADLFKTAGANRLMSVDLHAAQIQGFFDGPVDHLWALPVLSDYIVGKYETAEMTVVSPDAGRVRLADMWSDRLNSRLAIIHKRRDPDVANQVVVHEVVGEVQGRVCLLVDDMIDTAGTICQAAEALRSRGAKAVIAAATHAVLSGPAIERLKATAFEEVIVTNTLPIPPGTPLRRPDRTVHRPPDRPGHPRGLRGRLGHQPFRGPELSLRLSARDIVVATGRRAPTRVRFAPERRRRVRPRPSAIAYVSRQDGRKRIASGDAAPLLGWRPKVMSAKVERLPRRGSDRP